MALLSAAIRPGMPVIGSDTGVVGRVGAADRHHIVLRPDGAGRAHMIPLGAVAAVDGRQVTLLMPAAEAPLTPG